MALDRAIRCYNRESLKAALRTLRRQGLCLSGMISARGQHDLSEIRQKRIGDLRMRRREHEMDRGILAAADEPSLLVERIRDPVDIDIGAVCGEGEDAGLRLAHDAQTG